MPYISKTTREELERVCDRVDPANPGELNYVITRIVLNYVRRLTPGSVISRPLYEAEQLRYAVLNEAIGALECAKAEFVRRVVSPYEDRKIKENGDVYHT